MGSRGNPDRRKKKLGKKGAGNAGKRRFFREEKAEKKDGDKERPGRKGL